MLSIRDVTASYGLMPVLFGMSFDVPPGSCMALIGANGAGKSTTFSCITGLMEPTGGHVSLDGRDITGCPPRSALDAGIAFVQEGRKLFASLSVEDNLRAGAYVARKGSWTLQKVYSAFPVLRELKARTAGKLSGGQQQIVAIARALLSNPKFLICDEISLGLSPAAVSVIYDALRSVRDEGTALILVEQDISRSLSESERYVCIRHGRVVLEGASKSADRNLISEAYFGMNSHA